MFSLSIITLSPISLPLPSSFSCSSFDTETSFSEIKGKRLSEISFCCFVYHIFCSLYVFEHRFSRFYQSIFRISLRRQRRRSAVSDIHEFASAPQVSRLRPRSIPRTTFCATFRVGWRNISLSTARASSPFALGNIPVMLNPGQTVNTLTLPSSSAVNASGKTFERAALLALYAAAPATGQSADELEMFTLSSGRVIVSVSASYVPYALGIFRKC